MKLQYISYLGSLIISIPAFAGGVTGGSGLGKTALQQELAAIMLQGPDLGIEKAEISEEAYRRAKVRLSAVPFALMEVAGKDILVKEKFGALVNMTESLQIVPEPKSRAAELD